MIQFSTIFCTPFDFLLSISLYFLFFKHLFFYLLHPHFSRTHPLLFRHLIKTSVNMLAPDSKTEDVITVTSNLSKVHSLKAAIFHTLAFKLSLEINKNKITQKSLIAFLKGPKIAICETASNVVFVLNSAFTTKDHYFRVAIQEAITAFNNMLQDFGYTQKLEVYDPHTHQVHPPQQHPLCH